MVGRRSGRGGCYPNMLGEKQKCDVAIRNKCSEGYERDEIARGTLDQV